jgi:H+/Cl- antiporter ClcA
MNSRLIVVFFLIIGSVQSGIAQCAMCRTQLENNVSNGDIGIAAGINTGILYLLSMPYLIILVLGYFWYKSSRKNANSELSGSTLPR